MSALSKPRGGLYRRQDGALFLVRTTSEHSVRRTGNGQNGSFSLAGGRSHGAVTQ